MGVVVKQIECPSHPLTCIHVCWQRDLWLKPSCLVYFPQPQIGCSHVRVTHVGRLISCFAMRPPLNCAVGNSLAYSVSLVRNHGLAHWMTAINRHTGLFSFPLLKSLLFFRPCRLSSNRILITPLITANKLLFPSDTIHYPPPPPILQATVSESSNLCRVHQVCVNVCMEVFLPKRVVGLHVWTRFYVCVYPRVRLCTLSLCVR